MCRPRRQEPARAFQDLVARSTREPDDDQQVALAEIALLNAAHNESNQPSAAADWYVLAAARSYDFLFAKAPESRLFDLRYERMRVFYLRAAGRLFATTDQECWQRLWPPISARFWTHQYVVEIASGPELFDPSTFDELLFAAEMNFEGLINRHRRFGFGLAHGGFSQEHPRPARRPFLSQSRHLAGRHGAPAL